VRCTGDPTILHDAEAAMILAVFVAIRAAQKHRKQQNARNPADRKEGRSSPKGSSDCVRVNSKDNSLPPSTKTRANCESQATINIMRDRYLEILIENQPYILML
jgi:hypothetical protein